MARLDVDNAGAHAVPVVDGAHLVVIAGLVPRAVQKAANDELVVTAPVPYEMNWLADNVVGTIPQLDDEPKVPAL